jgi:hypothetical protein
MIWFIQKVILHYLFPNIWLHGSSTTNRIGINNSSLIINPSKRTFEGLSEDNVIYLTKSFWTALHYGSSLKKETFVDLYLVKAPYDCVEINFDDTLDEAIIRQNVKPIAKITMPSYLGIFLNMIEILTLALMFSDNRLILSIGVFGYALGLIMVNFIYLPNSFFYKKQSKIKYKFNY